MSVWAAGTASWARVACACPRPACPPCTATRPRLCGSTARTRRATRASWAAWPVRTGAATAACGTRPSKWRPVPAATTCTIWRRPLSAIWLTAQVSGCLPAAPPWALWAPREPGHHPCWLYLWPLQTPALWRGRVRNAVWTRTANRIMANGTAGANRTSTSPVRPVGRRGGAQKCQGPQFLCVNWEPVGMTQGVYLIQSEWKVRPVVPIKISKKLSGFLESPLGWPISSQSLRNNPTPRLASEAPNTRMDKQEVATCWPKANLSCISTVQEHRPGQQPVVSWTGPSTNSWGPWAGPRPSLHLCPCLHNDWSRLVFPKFQSWF